MVQERLLVGLAVKPPDMLLEVAAGADRGELLLQFARAIGGGPLDVLRDGLVGERTNRHDVDADEPYLAVGVRLVVGPQPGEELQDLFGAPRGSGVRQERPWIPCPGDQVLVELAALGPVLLQRHAAKAQLLYEQAHDPMLEGELLMGAMRGFPE